MDLFPHWLVRPGSLKQNFPNGMDSGAIQSGCHDHESVPCLV